MRGLLPGGWWSTCCRRQLPASTRLGKQAWDFPFTLTSLWPPLFQSLPLSPSSLLSRLGTNQDHILVQNMVRNRREPLFCGKQTNNGLGKVICGLPGRTQIAFLPQLCAATEVRLQHLRPWHHHLSRDLELLQEAQETFTSGQKPEALSTRGCSGGWMI